jgi:hypothetical protein
MNEKLSDDLLEGAVQIGLFLGMSPRRVFYCAEHGLLPIFKTGKRLTGLKSALRAHYAHLSSHAGAPTVNAD